MRLVLAGAGHAHLHLLAHAASLRAADLDVTLIAPAAFHYSGLATGVLSGALPESAAMIDVAALAAQQGVRHLPTNIVAVDLAAQVTRTAEGENQAFDLISFNIGSVVRDPLNLAAAPGVWPVKPLTRLFDLRKQLEAMLSRDRRSPHVVVAGGGQTGFEVAAAIAGLCERHGQIARLTLVSPHPATWAPRAAVADLLPRLRGRGIVILQGEVTGRGDGHCRLADGRDLECEMLVLAGGLTAPSLTGGLGLAMDAAGRLLLNPELQALDHPAVFAAGDCAVIAKAPRPPVGVFGVRAAPILLANLIARSQSGPLRPYRPQGRWLSIMDLGDETGLALRDKLWWRSRGALWVKRRLDLGFVARARGLRLAA